MSHIEDDRLHAYLDGQLAARERSEVEAHLAACAECRARRDAAERLVRESGALLERLDPGSPKAVPWSEIEARGAARSRRPRSSPWLDARFAWAASIALAFAVGWLTRGTQLPEELAIDLQTSALDSLAPLADRPLSLDEAQPPAAREESSTPTRMSAPVGRGERPAEVAKSTPRDTGGYAQAEPPPERRARAFADPAAPSAQARFEEDRAIALERIDVAGALTSTENELVEGASFFRAPPEVAATWLGAPVRTLPGHTLDKIEVGPGDAVRGGVSGRPVVRLVYKDASGHEITLLQQRDGSVADAAMSALIVTPSGLRAYRWSDRGYVLTLSGALSEDSLRALADRVR